MNSQHLSDEAVAAHADGVLTGHARARATRHTAECTECAAAVRGQREAAMALRAAAAPELPSGLLERLRGLPEVTPINALPTVVAPDGSTMLSTMAPMAAFVASEPGPRTGHRARPFVTTAAVIALAGAVAGGSVATRRDDTPSTGSGHVVRGVDPAGRGDTPATVFTNLDLFRAGGN